MILYKGTYELLTLEGFTYGHEILYTKRECGSVILRNLKNACSEQLWIARFLG